jgi:hypothetical protein
MNGALNSHLFSRCGNCKLVQKAPESTLLKFSSLFKYF